MSATLTVPDDGMVRQNFALKAITLQGKEYIITAQAQGQVQGIAQQLASNKIASVVSEARIQELPDFNAAQALSRLPGVSTLESSGEANKVLIPNTISKLNEAMESVGIKDIHGRSLYDAPGFKRVEYGGSFIKPN
jgi:hypothetical protein